MDYSWNIISWCWNLSPFLEKSLLIKIMIWNRPLTRELSEKSVKIRLITKTESASSDDSGLGFWLIKRAGGEGEEACIVGRIIPSHCTHLLLRSSSSSSSSWLSSLLLIFSGSSGIPFHSSVLWRSRSKFQPQRPQLTLLLLLLLPSCLTSSFHSYFLQVSKCSSNYMHIIWIWVCQLHLEL